jgi:hypothetical protein
MLVSRVLLRKDHVMLGAFLSFYYDPSVAPLSFGIVAMLGLVGSIIATM